MKTRYLLPAVLIGTCMSFPANGAGKGDMTLTTQPELAWEVTPQGVAFAPLRGNRFEESYMAMVRLPAGLVSPVHVKSATMFGIVVSGEIVHLPQDGKRSAEKILKTGAYYQIPAGLPHLSKCVSNEDCVTFLYQDGPFDFLPVSETGR